MRAAPAAISALLLALLVSAAPDAAAAETILPERGWIAHCIALRTSRGTPARAVRAYCRCMPGVVGALVRYDEFIQLVRAWPHSDAHCRRKSGLR